MSKNFLILSYVFGILFTLSFSAKSIQRFAMAEDTITMFISGTKVPSSVGSLNFRGREIQHQPNRRARDWLEFNIAPDNQPGTAHIYGEEVILKIHTYKDVGTVCFCIPTLFDNFRVHEFKIPLFMTDQENPECVLLLWRGDGMIARSKPPSRK